MDTGNDKIGSGSVVLNSEVNALLEAVIEGAKRAYYCRKNCKQVQAVLEQIQLPIAENPAALLGFLELLEEA